MWGESLFPTSPQPAEFGVGRVALSVVEGFSSCCPDAGVGKGFSGRIWSRRGGGMSLAERPYMVSRNTRDGLIHRHHANREGSLLPPDVVWTSHEAGVAKRQLNVSCLIDDERA